LQALETRVPDHAPDFAVSLCAAARAPVEASTARPSIKLFIMESARTEASKQNLPALSFSQHCRPDYNG
jgi:hypothetical protein